MADGTPVHLTNTSTYEKNSAVAGVKTGDGIAITRLCVLDQRPAFLYGVGATLGVTCTVM
jgi:hypothetical protein